MTDRKAVIKNADMSEDMQQDAVDCATQAMEKYNIEKDIAAYIKKVRRDGRVATASSGGRAELHLPLASFRRWRASSPLPFLLASIFGRRGDEALLIKAGQ